MYVFVSNVSNLVFLQKIFNIISVAGPFNFLKPTVNSKKS
jgi:hypothetical protein